MKNLRRIFDKRKLMFAFTMFYIYVGVVFVSPAGAKEVSFTPEEQDYINSVTVLKAVSIDGIGPLSYIDSKDEVRGIGISLLDKISEMTGLAFEYKLYNTVAEATASDYDIYLNATHSYATDDIILSQPYLTSETILCINASVPTGQLENKIHAAIKGGTLPQGVKAENTVYYNHREDTLNAVEKGRADYTYGNAYSVAFYTLQNGYKNIVAIPKGKEKREYCLGLPQKNDVLLSIMNKSIQAIDENQMQTLILDVTSHVERKITPTMIISIYGKELSGIALLVMAVLSFSFFSSIRANNRLKIENKKHELLSHISNECLFEYCIKSGHLEISAKFIETIDIQGKKDTVTNLLRNALDKLVNNSAHKNISTIKLPLSNDGTGVFRIICSNIYDTKNKLYSIAGKLIDISDEVTEKERLISKSRLDGLTGLYNATTTKELIISSIKNKKKNEMAALIIIDCDKFKNINDTFGHLKGDLALEDIGKKLLLTFRKTDIIGRIGGDEFCVYMHNIPSVDFVRAKSSKLLALFQKSSEDFQFTVSAGIAILNRDGTYEDFFKQADDALYLAKKNGGAQSIIYGETVFMQHFSGA